MGPIGCPETSVGNCHFTPCKISGEDRSHLHRSVRVRTHQQSRVGSNPVQWHKDTVVALWLTSWYDMIFINCNWVVTRWQYTFTRKQYIEQHKYKLMWKSAGRAPSLRVLPWHLPYNWGKRAENLSQGKKELSQVKKNLSQSEKPQSRVVPCVRGIWPPKQEESCGYCIYHQGKNRNSAFFPQST
jgi:hypothetical protein